MHRHHGSTANPLQILRSVSLALSIPPVFLHLNSWGKFYPSSFTTSCPSAFSPCLPIYLSHRNSRPLFISISRRVPPYCIAFDSRLTHIFLTIISVALFCPHVLCCCLHCHAVERHYFTWTLQRGKAQKRAAQYVLAESRRFALIFSF